MKITYDPKVDAAYIYLANPDPKRKRGDTYMCDPKEVGGMINLDFDDLGRMVGIEVIDASKKLPPEVLAKAVRPS